MKEESGEDMLRDSEREEKAGGSEVKAVTAERYRQE